MPCAVPTAMTEMPRRPLWALAGLIFVSRLAVILYLRTYAGDAGAYEHAEIARSLVEGQGFQFRFFADLPHPSGHQAPALPALLALGYLLFGVGAPGAVLFAQVLLAALTACGAAAAGAVAFHWWGRRGLWLTMLAFLCYPPFAYMPTRVQAVNWAVAFVLLMLWGFVTLAERRGGLRVAVATGVLAALGALGEPIVAAAFGTSWLALAWMTRREAGAWRTLAAVAAAFVVVVTPWLVRNQLVLGRAGFVKSSFGYVFWQGNHVGASGTDKRAVQPETAAELAWSVGGSGLEAALDAARAQAVSVDADLSAADSAAIRALPTEAARMQWFQSRVFAELRAAPGEYLRVVGRRVAMLAWFDDTNPRSFVAAYRVPWLLSLGLALAGLWRWRGTDRPAGVLLWGAALAGLVLVHALVIMSARFRLPIEALLLLPAVGAFLPRRAR